MRDWSQQNRNWFAAVQTEKRMMFIILTLNYCCRCFQLGIHAGDDGDGQAGGHCHLAHLGASPASIMKIFIIQGALVGLLGTAIGVSLGVLVALNVDVIVPFIEVVFHVQFLPRDIYLISALPSDLRWPDVWRIVGMSLVLAFLATFIRVGAQRVCVLRMLFVMNNPNLSASDVVLSCKGLGKRFTQGRDHLTVLENIDFSVSKGERVAIVGVSGSGKSTLLHLLGGLDLPTTGSVHLLGRDLATLSESTRGELTQSIAWFRVSISSFVAGVFCAR
jgi:hypothetical protein